MTWIEKITVITKMYYWHLERCTFHSHADFLMILICGELWTIDNYCYYRGDVIEHCYWCTLAQSCLKFVLKARLSWFFFWMCSYVVILHNFKSNNVIIQLTLIHALMVYKLPLNVQWKRFAHLDNQLEPVQLLGSVQGEKGRTHTHTHSVDASDIVL